MSKRELLVGNCSSELTFTTLCAAGLSLDKLLLPQGEKTFLLHFPYTPKPNKQNRFHLRALTALSFFTCFTPCCGFSHQYHPLLFLLLLHQSISQTHNLTCSAFRGAFVLSPVLYVASPHSGRLTMSLRSPKPEGQDCHATHIDSQAHTRGLSKMHVHSSHITTHACISYVDMYTPLCANTQAVQDTKTSILTKKTTTQS